MNAIDKLVVTYVVKIVKVIVIVVIIHMIFMSMMMMMMMKLLVLKVTLSLSSVVITNKIWKVIISVNFVYISIE